MIKIKLMGVDLQNKEHDLGVPEELTLVRSLYTPVSSLNCVVSTESPPPELKELYLTIDDKQKFAGFVDNQDYSITPNGAKLSFCARSRACVLLDNEAMPMAFTEATLRDIFNRYVKIHGFFVLNYPSDSGLYKYHYTVPKGISQWEAFANFCKLSYNIVPKFKDDFTLTLTTHPMLATMTISNTGKGDTNFISLRVKNDRYSPISGVSIRDSDGYYRSWIHNPENRKLKLTRERYILPTGSYNTTPRLDANEKIRLSMRKKVIVEAILPGIPQLDPGNLIYINEQGISLDFTPVAEEVKLIISSSGVFTQIKAINPKYI